MRQFCIGILLSALCNFWEYCRATPWITQNKNAEHVLQIRFCMQNMFCKLGSASRTCSACRTYSAKSKLFQWIERADHVLLYEFCFINPYLFKSWHQNISNGLLEHSMFCNINPWYQNFPLNWKSSACSALWIFYVQYTLCILKPIDS